MSLCIGLLVNVVAFAFLLVILEQKLFGLNKEDEEKKPYEILFHKLSYGLNKKVIGIDALIEYDHYIYVAAILNDGIYPENTIIWLNGESGSIPDEILEDIGDELKRLMCLEYEDDLPVKILEYNIGLECNTFMVEYKDHTFLMESKKNPYHDLSIIINSDEHFGVFSILKLERFVDLCAEICDLYAEG